MSASDVQPIRYALILGQGRSGTNHLLRILNQSPHTHCRNEADRLRDSPLNQLENSRFFVQDEEELEAKWDEAVRSAALHMGARDQPLPCAKTWLYPGTRKPGIFYVRQRYRILHRLGRNGRPMDGKEVRFPRWMTTPNRLEQAFHVLKLNAVCGFADFVLRKRPAGKVLHIVRHPGGFTKSWLQRWVERRGDSAAKESCQRRLAELCAFAPDWAAQAKVPTEAIEKMSYVEAELWFWRYCNETVSQAGEGKPNYMRVVYEDLADHSIRVAREVYSFCELPWNEQIEQRVVAMSERSSSIARAWRQDLEPEFIEVVERVTENCPIMGWWG